MTVFQWGKVIEDPERGPAQVVICLDCFDWSMGKPLDCRLWLINHMDKHPSSNRYESNIEYNDPKRYD